MLGFKCFRFNCHFITCWFSPLTWMQLQTRNVLFQLTSQNQFGAVFSLCTIIDQQKICMPIVQNSQFRSVRLWVKNIKWCIFVFQLKIRQMSDMQITNLGELMLWHGTSRLWPNNSWLRSTIPHGAIPILTTRPVRCWPSNKSASPTCFVTPSNNTNNKNPQSNHKMCWFSFNIRQILPVFVPPVKTHAPVVLAAFNRPFRISYKF